MPAHTSQWAEHPQTQAPPSALGGGQGGGAACRLSLVPLASSLEREPQRWGQKTNAIALKLRTAGPSLVTGREQGLLRHRDIC